MIEITAKTHLIFWLSCQPGGRNSIQGEANELTSSSSDDDDEDDGN